MTKVTGPDYLIVGMEKSGTTWCSTILNGHPNILSITVRLDWKSSGKNIKSEWDKELIGELHFFNTIASLNKNKSLYQRPISNYLTKHKLVFRDIALMEGTLSNIELKKRFYKRYNEIFSVQREQQGKDIAGESTPAYIFYLKEIDKIYPTLKKICILRDPKDKVVSWFYNELRKTKTKNKNISTSFIEEYCTLRINKEYEALFEYKGDIKCILYEDLNSENIYVVVQDILDYLNCSYDYITIKKMVSSANFSILTKHDHGTISREKGEENIDSQFRKGIVGDWKNNLSLAQASIVDKLTNKYKNKVYKKYGLLHH